MTGPERAGGRAQARPAEHDTVTKRVATERSAWWLGHRATYTELAAAGYDPLQLRPGDIVDITISPVRHGAGHLAGRVAVLERRMRRLTDQLEEVA